MVRAKPGPTSLAFEFNPILRIFQFLRLDQKTVLFIRELGVTGIIRCDNRFSLRHHLKEFEIPAFSAGGEHSAVHFGHDLRDLSVG